MVGEKIKKYTEILLESPGNAGALHQLGTALIEAGEYGRAAAIIKRAIEIDSGNPAYYSNAGFAFEKAGCFEEALAHYQVAMALNPDLPEAVNGLASIKGTLESMTQDSVDTSDPVYMNSLKCMIKSFCSVPNGIRGYYSDGRMKFYQNCIDVMIDHGIAIEGKDVIDVACGMGYQLKFFFDYKPASITGLDYSPISVNVAKLLCPSVNYHVYDLYQECDKKADIVICQQALEHLLYPEKAIKNILSMVKQGGSVFLSVPNGREDTFIEHINFWSPESWKVFIEKNSEGLGCYVGGADSAMGNLYAVIDA